mmetsp:Transcript_102486/g.294016  ORF Transcript_102486/g.294016 Transcript_102486/m.294016 type:complete len:309 (-) Transcript_102486:240-1166(-)
MRLDHARVALQLTAAAAARIRSGLAGLGLRQGSTTDLGRQSQSNSRIDQVLADLRTALAPLGHEEIFKLLLLEVGAQALHRLHSSQHALLASGQGQDLRGHCMRKWALGAFGRLGHMLQMDERLVKAAALSSGRCQDRSHARSEGIARHTGTGGCNALVVAAPQLCCHQAGIDGDVGDVAKLLEETEHDVQHLDGIVTEQGGGERGDVRQECRVLVNGRAQLVCDVGGRLAELAHRIDDTCKVELCDLAGGLGSLPIIKHSGAITARIALTRLEGNGVAFARAVALAGGGTFSDLRVWLRGAKAGNAD